MSQPKPPVASLRARSLPLLALVLAYQRVLRTSPAARRKREPSGNPGQLRLEGIR
jgi:hypothetical protein